MQGVPQGAQNQKFSESFKSRVESLESRAKAAGLSLTAMCQEVGASPYTLRRWRTALPYTIQLVDKLEAVVDSKEAEVSARLN